MDTETTETDIITDIDEGEKGTELETLTVSKKDYETLNQTLGSLKRELKDLKKVKEEPKEPPKLADNTLLQKSFLRAAGIVAPDEVELALSTAKKWGVEVDALVDDGDFQVKLEKLRTTKANADATSNVRGGASPSQAKQTPDYWLAKGIPPTPDDVPDRKTRQGIINTMRKSAHSGGKQFYND